MVIAAGDTGMIAWANDKDATDTAQAATLAGKLDTAVASGTFGARLIQRSFPRNAVYPPLMTMPPTLGAVVAGSPASSIAGAVLIPACTLPGDPATLVSPNFTYQGGIPMVAPAYYFVRANVRVGISTALSIEGDYYGAKFEFGYRGEGNLSSRVWIDGQPAEPILTTDTTQDGAVHLRAVTFAAPGWRRVKIEMSASFYGLNIGPTDTWIPAAPATEKLLIIGDSLGGGTGASGEFSGYAQTLGILLGYPSTFSWSIGGTGLLAPGTSLTYRGRSADWPTVGATAALIQMSFNDDGSTPAAIAAELALLVPIVQALPTVKDVWIMGTAARGGGDVVTKQSREPALAAQAAALGVPYINLVSPYPLWTGTGRVGATTGVGNSDITLGSDGAHPTQAGHDMIARAVATGIIASRPTT